MLQPEHITGHRISNAVLRPKPKIGRSGCYNQCILLVVGLATRSYDLNLKSVVADATTSAYYWS